MQGGDMKAIYLTQTEESYSCPNIYNSLNFLEKYQPKLVVMRPGIHQDICYDKKIPTYHRNKFIRIK
jgi:hypothetical protein